MYGRVFIRDFFPLIAIATGVIVLVFAILNRPTYINENDHIRDDDERIIKRFNSLNGYSFEELMTLEIKYLGEVDGYRIYDRESKGIACADGSGWEVYGYEVPSVSYCRIIGISEGKLYILNVLINEHRIDVDALYELVSNEVVW